MTALCLGGHLSASSGPSPLPPLSRRAQGGGALRILVTDDWGSAGRPKERCGRKPWRLDSLNKHRKSPAR